MLIFFLVKKVVPWAPLKVISDNIITLGGFRKSRQMASWLAQWRREPVIVIRQRLY